MEKPNVTQVQAGAGGAFAVLLTLAIQSGMTGPDLLVVAASAALVTCAAVLSDAIIRNGRASIEAAEMHGMQGSLALRGHYDAAATPTDADA